MASLDEQVFLFCVWLLFQLRSCVKRTMLDRKSLLIGDAITIDINFYLKFVLLTGFVPIPKVIGYRILTAKQRIDGVQILRDLAAKRHREVHATGLFSKRVHRVPCL